MQVELKIPVNLDGVTYKKGTHELPPESTIGWFFEALKSDGNLIVISKYKSEKSIKDEDLTKTEKKSKKKSKKKHKEAEVNQD